MPFVWISHLRFQISNQQIGAQNPWGPYETIEDRDEWLRQLQDWIREELAPRLGGG